jgi:hypothetical protein
MMGVTAMFRGLTDFGRQRTVLQAVGFYLVYLILGVLLGAALGALAGAVSGQNTFEMGLRVGMVMAMVVCPLLSFAILFAKGQMRHIGFLLVAVLSLAGAAFGGLIIGLLFVAFLTTRPSASSTASVETDPAFA